MVKRILAVFATVALLSCGEDTPTGPTPGELAVRLHGPAGAGAALLMVQGGPIDTVVGERYFTAFGPFSGTAKRVLVAGDNLEGVLVKFRVPDRRTKYTAVVMQIADGTTYQLLNPGGFEATVERP
jgi:hypothetical protein